MAGTGPAMTGEGVIPGEPEAREGDPHSSLALWIPFPSDGFTISGRE
jgi:hypothetical protein